MWGFLRASVQRCSFFFLCWILSVSCGFILCFFFYILSASCPCFLFYFIFFAPCVSGLWHWAINQKNNHNRQLKLLTDVKLLCRLFGYCYSLSKFDFFSDKKIHFILFYFIFLFFYLLWHQIFQTKADINVNTSNLDNSWWLELTSSNSLCLFFKER